jgi:hypothetical protein
MFRDLISSRPSRYLLFIIIPDIMESPGIYSCQTFCREVAHDRIQRIRQIRCTGLAELVKKKKVKPIELCEEAISRIEKINPVINAVICRMYDSAKQQAMKKLPPGPFGGVPFLLKDAVHRVAGFRSPRVPNR